MSRQTDEIYLLNYATPHSAKIRGAVLEVKRLAEVDPGGLELWSPALKAGFPPSAPMVQSAFTALGLPHPTFQRRAYAFDEFLAEIVGRNAAFRAVQVSKGRRQFMFGGCAAQALAFRQLRGIDPRSSGRRTSRWCDVPTQVKLLQLRSDSWQYRRHTYSGR